MAYIQVNEVNSRNIKRGLIVVFMSMLAACHKHGSNTPQCAFDEPNGIVFELKVNGQYVVDVDFLSQVKMSFYDGGQKNMWMI